MEQETVLKPQINGDPTVIILFLLLLAALNGIRSLSGFILHIGYPQNMGAVTILATYIGALIVDIVVIVAFVVVLIKKLQFQRILKKGQRVECPIDRIEHRIIKGTKRKIRSSWIIHCEWRDPQSGIVYHYKARGFRTDPQRYLEASGIRTVPVCLDDRNRERYVVDVWSI